ncbi:MAG: YheV family putative metal-binding protein [Gammaproteobacteria bacterium]
MSRLRRFIAGARCPRCEAIDTLALEEREGQKVCLCVTCGFSDALDRAAGGADDPRNRPLGEREPEATPVRIREPPPARG